MVGDHQLARLDENDYCVPYVLEDLQSPNLFGDEWSAVIVSDYGKGSISKEVIQYLREVGLPVFVDTKCDPTPWIGSEAVMFPNLAEYKEFQQAYEWFAKVLLKRSSEGISLVEYGNVILSRPSCARFVRSVNGAGDTTLAAFVTSVMSGGNLDYCMRFAMAAAAISVENPFTYTPTLEEVETRLNS